MKSYDGPIKRAIDQIYELLNIDLTDDWNKYTALVHILLNVYNAGYNETTDLCEK